ncbi:MAG: hypothetical protein ABEI74_00130 [Candidatus Pacearchaeota archaeon]
MAEIEQNQENPIFGRKEVSLEVSKDEYEPTYSNALKILSDKFSVDREALKINKLDVAFGRNKFKIFANVYNSPEEKQKVESKSKKEQEAEQKIEEEKKAAEQPQESEEGSEEE